MPDGRNTGGVGPTPILQTRESRLHGRTRQRLVGGTILGPFFAFQVLSNGPDRSRLLSKGTRETFAITHASD